MANTEQPHILNEDGTTKKLSDKHLALARRGAELTRLIKDQKTELDKVNDQLKKEIGPGVSLVLPEECRIPIAESISYSISDAAALKQQLGTRKFNLMVTTAIAYKPDAVLLDMAKDSAEVAEHLSERRSVSVKYLPIKTQK